MVEGMILSQTTAKHLQLPNLQLFPRLRRSHLDDRHNIPNGQDYCTLEATIVRDKMYRGDVNKCSRGTTALLSYTTVNDTAAQIECSSTRSAIELWSGAARCNRLGEDCKRSQGVRTPRTIAV